MLLRVLRLDRINQLKAAENVETLRRLDAVVATSLDAVITLDDAGYITEFNLAATQTFGLSAAEALGQPLDLIIPPAADGRPQLPPPEPSGEQHPQRHRVTARHSDGHELRLEAGADAHFVQKLSRPDETLTFTLARSVTQERERYDYTNTSPLPPAAPTPPPARCSAPP